MQFVENLIEATIEYPGMIVWGPNDWSEAPGPLPIIFMHLGMGEIGNGGTIDLKRVKINGTLTAIENGIRREEIVLVEIQSSAFYNYRETARAWQWAYKNLGNKIDWNRCYSSGLSRGGGACLRSATEEIELIKKFAAFVPVCPALAGGMVKPTNYVNYALSKRPMIITTCLDDLQVIPNDNAFLFVSKIKAINPAAPIQLITWPSGGHGGAWQKTYDINSTDFDGGNIYDWMLKHSLPAENVPVPQPQPNPDPVIVEPIPNTPRPIPPAPGAVKKITGINFFGDSLKIQALFKNGTSKYFFAPAGDKSGNIWLPFAVKNIRATMSFKKKENKPKQIGPFVGLAGINIYGSVLKVEVLYSNNDKSVVILDSANNAWVPELLPIRVTLSSSKTKKTKVIGPNK